MKTILSFLAAICLWACADDKTTAITLPTESVTVEIQITPEAIEPITRSTDETVIKDLNFYLFGRTNGQRIHVYSQSSLLRFECSPGDYDLYIAANLHADLGDLSVAELAGHMISYNANYTNLPMSATEAVTIPAGDGSTVSLPAISVRRNVAKVAYNIVVDTAVSGIQLSSVQMMNLPRSTGLFERANQPSGNNTDYTNGIRTLIPSENATQFTDVCYLFENAQGRVASIGDQKFKNPANAPKYASYLLIRAIHGTKALAYTVYLGENNTDNFDVRRNSFHTLHIAIKGENEIDTRISSYTLSVWDDIESSNVYNGYCVQSSQKSLHIDIQGRNNEMQLHAEISVKVGDPLKLDGVTVRGALRFDIPEQNGSNSFVLNYTPEIFDATTATLAYTVTVFDDYGVSQSFNFEHRYANSITTYIFRAGMTNGKGSISASSGLYSKEETNRVNSLYTLCNENGCTLTATPDPGYKFAGWYSDSAFSKQLSPAASYAYKPTVATGLIYARFVVTDTTPLDTNGTANCYIAAPGGRWFSFDATVMGNGKATTNISPKKLSGTSAKVIWETGTVRGAIIEHVIYDGGRITFKTGTQGGNAVIGFFNISGTCVWSWHIWATSMNPGPLNWQSYSSGAVFMGCNLGSTSTISDPENLMRSTGLYYQWGRKDPFPNQGSNLAPHTCLDGYEFEIRNNSHTMQPANIYTLAWATAHPTSFLCGAPAAAGSSAVLNSSWLTILNYNLWGNTTNGEVQSLVNVKTIYDPCPPGWKVPHRSAWDMARFKKAFEHPSQGWEMYFNTTDNRASYPYTGYLTAGDNDFRFYLTTSQVYMWTCEPTVKTTFSDAYYLYILSSGVTQNTAMISQDNAMPIRCIKE